MPLRFLPAVLMLVLPVGAAHAWVRTPTCYLNQPGNPLGCRPDEVPEPIYWPQVCVPWMLQQDGSPGLSVAETQAVVERSFAAWRQELCASWDPQFDGLVASRNVGLDRETNLPDRNVVLFTTQGWPHASRIQALTSVTYRISNGEIVDADIDVNAQFFEVGIVRGLQDSGLLDLQNVLTHEIGHFLGLDHTQEATHVGPGTFRDATMFESAGLGETSKRALHPDDIAGLCTIYPRRPDHESCVCIPTAEGGVRVPQRPCLPWEGDPAVPPPGRDAGGGGASDAGIGGDAGGIVRRRQNDCAAARGPTPDGPLVVALIALLGQRRRRRARP